MNKERNFSERNFSQVGKPLKFVRINFTKG